MIGTCVLLAAALMTPFRPGEVAVGGEIGRRMEVTLAKMLRHTDIDGTFARHFRVRKEKPDEPGGFAGYGMFLDALVKAAAHGVGGAETVAAKTRLLQELGALQTSDGRISMYSGKPGFWDNHEGAYMIQALCLDHRWFGTASSLETAKRLADSLIANKSFPTLGSETAYLLLYQETKDRRYLEWLERDAAIALDIDAYDRQVRVNGVQHVYTWLARALAQLQYADAVDASAADRAKLSAATLEAFERTRGPYLSITGSLTGTPRWGELWDATQVGLGKWGETCASAYLMRLAAKAQERADDTFCGDLIERVMYNAFFSAQSADGLKYRYWTPFNERAPWYDRDTYCCPNNYKREVFELPDAVFYRLADGLAVNLFSDATLKAEGVAATMRTAYPDDGKVSLEVTMKGRVLKLRIPAWCEKGATVRVAGGPAQPANPGWFRLEHDFSSTTKIELDLPMLIRLVPGTRAQEGRMAVMRGPCVYALALGTEEKPEHEVDLWDLDTSAPLTWRPETKTVEATFRNRNRTRTVKRLPLTRYSADIHDRTYFDPVKPGVCELAHDAARPQLRFTQASGWANDPNGMVFWKGEWHFFHQHNPFGVTWGNMHWNHAVSRDLVHWTELGDALAMDSLGGMWSGSAVTDRTGSAGFGKGAMVLAYTAAGCDVNPPKPFVQCLAFSTDGRTFAKPACNPVLLSIAGDGNRDPKIFWHEPTKRWVMALYGTRNERQSVIILTSPNLKNWTETSVYAGPLRSAKPMDLWLFECPGLEELKVEGETNTAWVVWGASGDYAVGSFDGRTFVPSEERLTGYAHPDGVLPFYAAQTYNDVPDGRAIWVAWFRLPYRDGAMFSQSFSLPQELTLRRTPQGLRLVRRPARELKKLRVGEAVELERFDGELAEIHLSCKLRPDSVVSFDLRGVPLAYDAAKGRLTMAGTTAPWKLADGRLALTVFLDRAGAEIFSDDGLQMMAVPDAFPDAVKTKLAVRRADGATECAFTAWSLRSIYESTGEASGF